MYELFESVQGYNPNDKLIETASSLCKQLNFNDWKIIMLNQEKLFGFIFSSSEDKPRSRPKGRKKAFYSLTTYTYLNLALHEDNRLMIY